MTAFRHPVVAVSHGPGPLWLLSSGFAGMSNSSLPARTLTSTFEKLYPKGEHLPKRILFISAHWESESSGFEISSAARPEMIYDYSGFPREAYEGDPAFAQNVKQQLEQHDIKAKLVDRGVFVPMRHVGAHAWLQPASRADRVGMEENRPQAEKLFGGWGMGHMSFASYAWGVEHSADTSTSNPLTKPAVMRPLLSSASVLLFPS
ncbi:UDP-N-acetylglucosamine--peptide N-acetylglucosaminyltransferase SEC [Phytophthora cinnamomi]|uniref:UDP-N-acetylglucosamine--peptide N-acetylglucosaminyltransferase SEC n=1 Tax=Phytophthora cinnamomi TaxID=4785 RepID=UPI00355AA847|nr:UDP-N-acetylglucosamine--peptide N-acetylglucosaminyltransferase SEC [Phytophthora cinnamomi]